MRQIWRKRSVSYEEWALENNKYGSVYFLKDHHRDMVKIGHSRTPFDRMGVLQIGSAGRLQMIGVMAAPREFEATLHAAFKEGHVHGEWFFDREMISLFLFDVSDGQTMCRMAWEFGPASPEYWVEWDKDAKSHHVISRFDPGTGRWELIKQ